MTMQGKVAVVTGATSGIGYATARRLAESGAHVVAVGRSAPGLVAAEAMLADRGEVIGCDVADTSAIERLMDEVKRRHQRLDTLVLCAGVSNAPAVAELKPDAYARLMDVNCRAAAFAFVYALPLLTEGGSVIFVGSIAGRKGQPGDALYAGSKGFVRAFARTAGTDPDIMARQIRVNVVSPGPIETPLTGEATSHEGVRSFVEALIPMHRWGRAEEVAEAILFLASDASSFTTGAEITVDGGMAHV